MSFGNFVDASSMTDRLKVMYANLSPGRRFTYSNNVVVLPVPANARTSMTWSFLTSALTMECCSCVSREVKPPSEPRYVVALWTSRYPAAASRCAIRVAHGSERCVSPGSIAPRVHRDGTVSAMVSSDTNSVRSSAAQ